eukprot:scaffold79803_cov32-Tisochrysis_lutea.AAC.1
MVIIGYFAQDIHEVLVQVSREGRITLDGAALSRPEREYVARAVAVRNPAPHAAHQVAPSLLADRILRSAATRAHCMVSSREEAVKGGRAGGLCGQWLRARGRGRARPDPAREERSSRAEAADQAHEGQRSHGQ